MASVDINTGLTQVPTVRKLVEGLFGFHGPKPLIVSWTIVGAFAYLSTSVGVVAMIVVALFATFMILVGVVWLGIRQVI